MIDAITALLVFSGTIYAAGVVIVAGGLLLLAYPPAPDAKAVRGAFVLGAAWPAWVWRLC